MSGFLLKRVFDIALVLTVLPIALPLAGAVALLVWSTLGRPILFSQRRAGFGGKVFLLHKFRSMEALGDRDYRAVPDRARLNAMGLWLRRSSLDELPQLWNILRGDMSFVGPRPLPDIYLPRYSAEQNRRHLVPAGLTGWAQIHGRNELSWPEKFQLDVWYADHRSFALDMQILRRTVFKVLRGEDVATTGEATTKEFQQN